MSPPPPPLLAAVAVGAAVVEANRLSKGSTLEFAAAAAGAGAGADWGGGVKLEGFVAPELWKAPNPASALWKLPNPALALELTPWNAPNP